MCDDGTKYVVDFSCVQFSEDQGDCGSSSSPSPSAEAEESSSSPIPYFYQYENEYYPSQSGTMSSLTMLLGHGYNGTPDDLCSNMECHFHSPFGLADIFNEVNANGMTERPFRCRMGMLKA